MNQIFLLESIYIHIYIYRYVHDSDILWIAIYFGPQKWGKAQNFLRAAQQRAAYVVKKAKHDAAGVSVVGGFGAPKCQVP